MTTFMRQGAGKIGGRESHWKEEVKKKSLLKCMTPNNVLKARGEP